MHPTEALTTMSFANFLRMTDAVGLFVFGLLILMSIVSWYFIFLKSARVIRIRTRSSRVVTFHASQKLKAMVEAANHAGSQPS